MSLGMIYIVGAAIAVGYFLLGLVVLYATVLLFGNSEAYDNKWFVTLFWPVVIALVLLVAAGWVVYKAPDFTIGLATGLAARKRKRTTHERDQGSEHHEPGCEHDDAGAG